MVILCWEIHSSSYGSFLLIHKVLLTQNYCHEKDRCKGADIRSWVSFQSIQSSPFISLWTQRPDQVLRPSVGSAALLCTLRDYLLVFTSSFLPISGLWGCFYFTCCLSCPRFSFLLLTDIDNKCLNCDQLICFRQKLAYLEESEQWTAFFQIN